MYVCINKINNVYMFSKPIPFGFWLLTRIKCSLNWVVSWCLWYELTVSSCDPLKALKKTVLKLGWDPTETLLSNECMSSILKRSISSNFHNTSCFQNAKLHYLVLAWGSFYKSTLQLLQLRMNSVDRHEVVNCWVQSSVIPWNGILEKDKVNF